MAITQAIRTILNEGFVLRRRKAYDDIEIDTIFEAYLHSHSIYFVIEDQGLTLGGSDTYQLKLGNFNLCKLKKIYFLPDAGRNSFGMVIFCF